jgi:hypothetical protein
MNENTKLHAEIALVIKRCKKQLFKRHREGMNIKSAVNTFLLEVDQRIDELTGAAENPDWLKKPEWQNRFTGRP